MDDGAPVIYHDDHTLSIDTKTSPYDHRRELRRGTCSCGWTGCWYATEEPLEESIGRHLRAATM
jgi:hypothetical protein